MYQLRKWSLDDGRYMCVGLPDCVPLFAEIPADQRRIFARGNVGEHPKFADNTRIHTSQTMKFEVNENENRFLMETESGSQYQLKFEEADISIFGNTKNCL